MKTAGKIKMSMLALGVAFIGIVSCNRDKEPETVAVSTDNTTELVTQDEYEKMVAAKNATEDTLYQTINEIDNNLRSIRENQGLLANNNGERFSKKEEILRTIKEISSLLEQNKEKIKKLNGQLASLRSQKQKWSKESEEMKKFIADREQEVLGLQQLMSDQTSTINYLNQIVDELKTANHYVADNAKRLDNELHTAFYAMGSYRELKDHNVVEKKGGVLGLGATKELKDDFEKEYFTEIDTRQVTSIPVNSRKAKLVTNHPVGSYEWHKEGDDGNTDYLTITDPEKFWAASKYLVVEVK